MPGRVLAARPGVPGPPPAYHEKVDAGKEQSRCDGEEGRPLSQKGERANGDRSGTKTLSSFDSRPNPTMNLHIEVKKGGGS